MVYEMIFFFLLPRSLCKQCPQTRTILIAKSLASETSLVTTVQYEIYVSQVADDTKPSSSRKTHSRVEQKDLPFLKGQMCLHAALQNFRRTLHSREYQVQKSTSSRLYSACNLEPYSNISSLIISGLFKYNKYCTGIGGGTVRIPEVHSRVDEFFIDVLAHVQIEHCHSLLSPASPWHITHYSVQIRMKNQDSDFL